MHRAERPFALGMFERSPGEPAIVGIVEALKWVYPLADVLEGAQSCPTGLPAAPSIFALLQDWGRNFPIIAQAVTQRLEGLQASRIDVSRLTALAPIAEARQLICTGANYRKHVIDLVVAQGAGADTEGMSVEQRRAHVTRRVESRAANGIPYAFPKLVSSLCGPQGDLVIPADASQFDWELELGVVIGRAAWRVPREQAGSVIAGYTIVNDLTRRELVYREDLKSIGSDWLRAKSGPGFMPTGPYFVPAAFVSDPQALQIRLELNGQVMQDESTADMLFDINRQIEYVSSYARLLPGDILATGSPAGNGMHYGRFLQPGDEMRGSISGLGTQIHRCIAEVR